MRNIQKFHIGIRPALQKSVNGEYPIYIRIYIDSRRTELSTLLYVPQKQWDNKHFKVKPSHPDYNHINTRLADIKAELRREFLLMASTTEQVNIHDLKKKYLKVDDKPIYKTICQAFDYHNAKVDLMVKANKLSEETLERYYITKKKIVGLRIIFY